MLPLNCIPAKSPGVFVHCRKLSPGNWAHNVYDHNVIFRCFIGAYLLFISLVYKYL